MVLFHSPCFYSHSPIPVVSHKSEVGCCPQCPSQESRQRSLSSSETTLNTCPDLRHVRVAMATPWCFVSMATLRVLTPSLLLCSRWIRLLFGREFPLSSVLEVWDAVFADGPSLVDYMCVAMLMHIREVCESFQFQYTHHSLCLLCVFCVCSMYCDIEAIIVCVCVHAVILRLLLMYCVCVCVSMQ